MKNRIDMAVVEFNTFIVTFSPSICTLFNNLPVKLMSHLLFRTNASKQRLQQSTRAFSIIQQVQRRSTKAKVSPRKKPGGEQKTVMQQDCETACGSSKGEHQFERKTMCGQMTFHASLQHNIGYNGSTTCSRHVKQFSFSSMITSLKDKSDQIKKKIIIKKMEKQADFSLKEKISYSS